MMDLDDITKITAVAAVGTTIFLSSLSRDIFQSIEPYLLAREYIAYESNRGERK